MRLKWICYGLCFSILWASASTATKIGLVSAQPLVIALIRFGVAAFLMLLISHAVVGNRLPAGKEWKQIVVYSLLNITVYLGLYVIAMQYVTAGIAALAVAANPVIISFISVFFMGRKLTPHLSAAILICIAGVVCASLPLFGQAAVSAKGLLILFLSMLSYSLGALYFSNRHWKDLDLFTINGWQTFIGGVLLLPFTFYYYHGSLNHYDREFWTAVLWLAIPVSIVAVQLWLWLLKANVVKAGMWLFLCPLFGFAISGWLLKEAITLYTVAGIGLVIGGLVVAQKDPARDKVPEE